MPQTHSRAAARRLALRQLIEHGDAATQEDLCAALARRGHPVTQATVSRDLVALGAVKHGERYALLPRVPADPGVLPQRLRQFVLQIDASANIVVVRTPPGSAHAVAVALDAARGDGILSDVLGTVAGDDTLLAVTRAPDGAARVARELESMME